MFEDKVKHYIDKGVNIHFTYQEWVILYIESIFNINQVSKANSLLPTDLLIQDYNEYNQIKDGIKLKLDILV